MACVALEEVNKVYPDGYHAVKDVSLQIGDEELVVFVGPSGCGKSTTLRMIAGLETPSSGTLRIDGRVANDLPPGERDVAMVFQNYALYPHMTVFDNMAFALTLRKLPRAAIRERVLSAARLLGLEPHLERLPRALSGGQRQRVAVGRAIVRNPRCFLFDEPLSNLDARLRLEMRAELKRLHLELRSTTVYVTHDQEEAMTLGDRVVVMKDGVIQQCAPPLELYRHPTNRFVAGFVGTPPMNFLTGRVVADDGLWFDEGAQRVRVPAALAPALESRRGQDVVLGVRAQALEPVPDGARAAPGSYLDATVRLCEPLGDRMHLRVATGRHEGLIAEVPASTPPAPGTPVRLALDPARLHFFDAGAGGEALATGDRCSA